MPQTELQGLVSMKVLLRCYSLSLVCALGWSTPALADVTVGLIGSVEVVAAPSGAPGNFDFRITFAGSPVVCNGQTWAYINISDPNYQATVANILSARAMNLPVYISWVQNGSYCQIGFINW
jgi:hypothetical protein